jgi:hypothetical protein
MPHGSQTKRVKRVELLIGEKRDKDLETHEGLAVEEEEWRRLRIADVYCWT